MHFTTMRLMLVAISYFAFIYSHSHIDVAPARQIPARIPMLFRNPFNSLARHGIHFQLQRPSIPCKYCAALRGLL